MSSESDRFDSIKQAFEKAEQMGNCMTKILEFVESKGLYIELLQYLKNIKDPYFLRFWKRVEKQK